jgi:SET domain-containing protein
MKFEVKPSKIGGQGVHATTPIKVNEFITTFEGRPETNAEVLRLTAEGVIRRDDPLQIDEDLYLVADFTHPSIYINHSCEPNAALRGRNEIIAVRDIAPGDEITYDYSMVVGNEVDWSMACNCGSTLCRKAISNWESIPVRTLKEYIGRGIMQDFMRKQITAKNPELFK